MGYRRSQIKFIDDRRRRSVSYRKRKQSLHRKAFELSVLCDVDVAVILLPRGGGAAEAWPADARRILERLGRRNDVQQLALPEAAESQTSRAPPPDDASGLAGHVEAKLDEVRARLMVYEMLSDAPLFDDGVGGGDEVMADTDFDPADFLGPSFDMDSFMEFVNAPLDVGYGGDLAHAHSSRSAKCPLVDKPDELLSLTWDCKEEEQCAYIEAPC
ncbi:uncharacterized protein [Typha angustifolia]|uniref:uncharacterized protein n=1 Tax=Typha angustifolia TaxID=59011 RepID=UPI003C2D3675